MGEAPGIVGFIRARLDEAPQDERTAAFRALTDRCEREDHHARVYFQQNYRHGKPSTFRSGGSRSRCPVADDVLRTIAGIWPAHPDWKESWTA